MSDSISNMGPIPGLRKGPLSGVLGGLRKGPGIGESIESVTGWWKGRSPQFRKRALVAAVLVLVGGGVATYFVVRPVPQPDYDMAGLDDVFNYTLLTDEFNKLPVEKRLELMGKLVSRLKNMSAGDSMLLAAFASGIAGSARDQIERNASKLAIDVWDKYAADYSTVKTEDREQFLETTFVEFTKMMEVAVDGKPSDKTDEERISEMKKQVERDRERMRDPDRVPTGQEMGRFLSFVNGNVGGHANAQQRTRGQAMLRDMARHFRGQDISTGKEKGPG